VRKESSPLQSELRLDWQLYRPPQLRLSSPRIGCIAYVADFNDRSASRAASIESAATPVRDEGDADSSR
jgi:hypothetical protein